MIDRLIKKRKYNSQKKYLFRKKEEDRTNLVYPYLV